MSCVTLNKDSRTEIKGKLRLSVVIPCWGDCYLTLEVIKQLKHLTEIDWVVSAYQPSNYLKKVLQQLGVSCAICPVASRGLQMNIGARQAQGDVLLFHHADSILEESQIESIHRSLENEKIIGGAFYRKFDDRHPRLRFLENFERWHSRSFGTLYGDQSLFVRSSTFEKMEGFCNCPILEDVEFSGRLRREGTIALLDPPMVSSPRKHLENGPWRTTMENAAVLLLYRPGVSPQKLHQWYYRENGKLQHLRQSHES